MASKLALVVDDSRMARHMLSKMLTEQGIEVDTVESGEEALGYLCGKKPSMIFMDHTMPGMDGFQTVRAIKNDPHTAAIPIIMYTSQEGEVYESQARALGAVDVIPKTLKPLQLTKVLERQNLLPGQAASAAATDTLIARPAANDVVIVENQTAIRSVFDNYREEQAYIEEKAADTKPSTKPTELVELEDRIRQLNAQLDQFSQIPPTVPRPSGRGYRLQYLGLALCVVLIGFLLLNYTQMSQQLSEIRSENASLKQSKTTVPSSTAETVPTQRRSELNTPASPRQPETSRRFYESMEWSLNEEGQFPLGEKPFNDKLAATLAQLAENLHSSNFQGEISVRSHLGRFCVITGASGELEVPEDGPLGSCEVMEFDPALVESVGMEQTPGFTNFQSAFESEYGNTMHLNLSTVGDRRPLVRYPKFDPELDADRWNKAAAQNQRVEISINPQ
ncbi:MAG TPA: response regulator [Dongiaceae bacterium]|nr:response regulator [Dongiaceae bacterium]